MFILSWHLNNSWQPWAGSNCHVVGVPAIRFCRNWVPAIKFWRNGVPAIQFCRNRSSQIPVMRSSYGLNCYHNMFPILWSIILPFFAFGLKNGVEDLYQLSLIFKHEKICKMQHNKNEDMIWTTFEFCQHCCCVSKIVENVTYILE